MKIFHSDTISWTELGDFVFIFNEVTGTFFKFEGVLKELWLTLESSNDFEEVVEKIFSKYDVEKNELREDLLQAIHQLENQQLLIRR